VPAFRLTIRPDLNFRPADSIIPVHAHPALSDNALQVAAANFIEESDAVLLDMLGVDDPFTPALLWRGG
jgi:hypothetical protein